MNKKAEDESFNVGGIFFYFPSLKSEKQEKFQEIALRLFKAQEKK